MLKNYIFIKNKCISLIILNSIKFELIDL